MAISLTEQGLSLPGSLTGSYDVYFDDQYVWSFTPGPGEAVPGGFEVPWPNAMKHWLDGRARIEVREGESTLFEQEASFGESTERIRFVDGNGIPVMIDKWGLLQRPFSGRGDGVVEQMIDITSQIIEVLDRELDIHCWLAFGSLLGAAREGKVIGHDSDVDLAYLSHRTTIVELNREMFEITRVLRRAGMRVLNKTGSFVTVLFTAPDGGDGSIDVYSCFYVSDQLHETATIRQPVPREAIEPLGTLEFEGRELPVPADPDTMLRVSYGPSWRVPDPSFQHLPPPSTTTRFDGWFGSLMHHRREWERWARLNRDTAGDGFTAFGRWALTGREDLPENPIVIDIGAGFGRDAVAAARAGVQKAHALDYARGGFAVARRLAEEEGLALQCHALNLYSYRDSVTKAAQLAHGPGPRVVLLGGVLDSLDPEGHDSVYAMLRMVVGRGGRAFLDFAHDLSRYEWKPNTGGARRAVAAVDVLARLERIGGHVDQTVIVPASRETMGMARTWLAVRWPEKEHE